MRNGSRAAGVALLAAAAALASAAPAFAHAEVAPLTVETGQPTQLTLSVPTERAGAATVAVRVVVPAGLDIAGVPASRGWPAARLGRTVKWSGRTRGEARLALTIRALRPGRYTLAVRQTYSDGTVVDWAGGEASSTPAPVLRAEAPATTGRDRLIIGLLGGGAVALWVLARRSRPRRRRPA